MPAFLELNHACRILTEAYGYHVYLVGSALERRDHRDVDVRLILPDEDFDRMFPGIGELSGYQWDARVSVLSVALSYYLAHRTGLNIDFQFQRASNANARYSGRPRHVLGIFVDVFPDPLRQRLEQAHEVLRKLRPSFQDRGLCRVVSKGEACDCPLCLIDNALAE